MNDYAYWAVLAGTAVVPLISATIHWRFSWGKQDWLRLLQVFVTVSAPFVLLDALSHARGWWAYNPAYVTGHTLLGLPVEEVVFFFVIPFACLYLYSSMERLSPTRQLVHARSWHVLCALLGAAAIALMVVEQKERTIIDAILFAVVVCLVAQKPPKRVVALWLLMVIGLFLMVNSMLTALPIVTYDIAYGSLYRIGTIPFEDFLYNCSFLLLCLLSWQTEPVRRLVRVVRRV